MGTALLLGYLAGCMLTLVPTARWYLTTLGDTPPDSADYVFSATLSLCTVWGWPLYLPGWWIVAMLKSGERGV